MKTRFVTLGIVSVLIGSIALYSGQGEGILVLIAGLVLIFTNLNQHTP